MRRCRMTIRYAILQIISAGLLYFFLLAEQHGDRNTDCGDCKHDGQEPQPSHRRAAFAVAVGGGRVRLGGGAVKTAGGTFLTVHFVVHLRFRKYLFTYGADAPMVVFVKLPAVGGLMPQGGDDRIGDGGRSLAVCKKLGAAVAGVILSIARLGAGGVLLIDLRQLVRMPLGRGEDVAAILADHGVVSVEMMEYFAQGLTMLTAQERQIYEAYLNGARLRARWDTARGTTLKTAAKTTVTEQVTVVFQIAEPTAYRFAAKCCSRLAINEASAVQVARRLLFQCMIVLFSANFL